MSQLSLPIKNIKESGVKRLYLNRFEVLTDSSDDMPLISGFSKKIVKNL